MRYLTDAEPLPDWVREVADLLAHRPRDGTNGNDSVNGGASMSHPEAIRGPDRAAS